MTKKQHEIETLVYFSPNKNLSITDEGVKMYFEWSEHGMHKDKIVQSNASEHKSFNDLVAAKQWRGRTIHELYEPGVLEGTTPYFTLLGGYENKRKWYEFWKSPHKPVPRCVVDFMKKEMFKGIDAGIIERCYQEIL